MEKQQTQFTEENKESIVAENNNIKTEDLISEMMPLLNEYFCGTFTAKLNKIDMVMNNGQQFQLSICEVQSI